MGTSRSRVVSAANRVSVGPWLCGVPPARVGPGKHGRSVASSGWWPRSRPKRPAAHSLSQRSVPATFAGAAAPPDCPALGREAAFFKPQPKLPHHRPNPTQTQSPKHWLVHSNYNNVCARSRRARLTLWKTPSPRHSTALPQTMPLPGSPTAAMVYSNNENALGFLSLHPLRLKVAICQPRDWPDH